MSQKNVNIFNWNPRGLNNRVRRDAVRDLIRDTHASIVCLQETKLDHVDDAIISATLGPNFTANYAFIPAIGTSGGMILSVSHAFFTISNVHATANTLSASITMLSEGTTWSISCVYGPQGESDKLLFIEELKGLKAIVQDAWLLLGDFNLITKASDKNNLNINRRLIGKFRAARDFLVLKDMRMDGRRFTWSNAQADPVLTKIDHVFCTADWDALFPDAHLQAITSACSDHAPFFLQGSVASPRKQSFKFEEFWLRMQGFKETVSEAWNKDILAHDPIRRVHIKLARTAKALKRWQRQSIGDLRIQVATAKEIILRMDQAEEARPLSDDERELRRQLKCSYLGLLSIQKIKLR
jgi:exonuclease III